MQNNNFPLVSIGVASFNNAKYIKETLNSILAIDYPEIELIVIDDASSDDSTQIIENWLLENDEFSARLIRNEKNKGLCHVSNQFIQAAQGKYISLIGSDDNYLPHKLAIQVPLLEAASPEVGLVFSDVSKIDSAGTIIVPSVYATGQISPSEGNVWLAMLRTNFVGAMTTLTRKGCFDQVGPYDETLVYEDWDMWLRIARKFEFIYHPDPTAHYRVHDKSISFQWRTQMIESNLRIVSKQLGLSAEGDAIIHQHIADFAEELYLLGSPQSSHWLDERYRLRPDRRGLALLWLARLGVPSTAVARAYGWLKHLTGKTNAPSS